MESRRWGINLIKIIGSIHLDVYSPSAATTRSKIPTTILEKTAESKRYSQEFWLPITLRISIISPATIYIYIYIWMEKFGARNRWNSETLLKGHAIHPQLRKKKKNHGKMGTFEKKSEEFLGKRSILFPFFFCLIRVIIRDNWANEWSPSRFVELVASRSRYCNCLEREIELDKRRGKVGGGGYKLVGRRRNGFRSCPLAEIMRSDTGIIKEAISTRRCAAAFLFGQNRNAPFPRKSKFSPLWNWKPVEYSV